MVDYDKDGGLPSAVQMVTNVTGEPMPLIMIAPHSRACGIRKHDHGVACHSNCPTCHGCQTFTTPTPAPHCGSCTCGKRAPLQGSPRRPGAVTSKPSGTISWAEHLECYTAYASRWGAEQSVERLAERGGFGWDEFVSLTGHEPTTWHPGDRRG